jgi:hypothetical protein
MRNSARNVSATSLCACSPGTEWMSSSTCALEMRSNSGRNSSAESGLKNAFDAISRIAIDIIA